MIKMFKSLFAIIFLLTATAHAQKLAPIDAKATKETKALYANLKKLSQANILFGHQHATEYGHGWSSSDSSRSDVKSVTGSHPAVVGFDFNALFGRNGEASDDRRTGALRKLITDTYNRNGITTIAWHFSNPVSNTGFNWNDSTASPAVPLIIPGGTHHAKYKEILGTVARFAKSCKGADSNLAPMIFRPFHEFDGGWFWWGATHCTPEEFTTLWRFTVSYLRDTLGVHNFIYTFSPDNKFNTEAEYLARYPGDQWVDMVGMDNYGDFGRDGRYNLEAGLRKIKIVSDYGKNHNKVAAFTETGLESTPNPTWWTETLLKMLKTNDLQLAYVLVWRNDARSATHFYAPFPGHSSVPDFLSFYKDPFTLFENDLKKVYK